MTIQAIRAQRTGSQISDLLVTVGCKVDESVSQAITALLHSNSHIVGGVMENAVTIQELEHAIDQAAFSALEQGNLSSAEVRHMTLAVSLGKDLGRLGKLAANLGRKVTEVGKHQEHEDFSSLEPLAIAVSHLCRQTLRSLTHLDSVLARNAAAGSGSVDAYRDYVLRRLGSHGPQTQDEQNLHLIFASRCLEQIADHASNLAENLVVFIEGNEPMADRRALAS